MSILRILHISDLHIRSGDHFDQHTIVEALLRDIDKFQQQTPFGLVVFSGDLAFAGKPEEFAGGRQLLLNPLMTRLGVTARHVVLVPGNHDVDRDLIDEIYEEGLALRLGTRDAVNAALDNPEVVDKALSRLTPWTRLSDGFYAGINRLLLPPGGWTYEMSLQDVRVGIAALNSAWRSTGSGDAERGKMLIGIQQLSNALNQLTSSRIRIVVVHHPLEWLTTFDANEVRTDLERNGTIVLTGHDHAAAPSMSVTPRGSAIYARAGCLYESQQYVNSYTVMDIDVTGGRVECNIRTWWSDRGDFDAAVNVAEGGKVRLPMVAPSSTLLTTLPFADVTGSLVGVIHRTSVVPDLLPNERARTVSDLLVTPRFYPVPYRELVAAAKTSDIRVERVDALAELGKHRVVIVCGEPESGVTGALAWVLEQRYMTDVAHLPLYIRFDPRQGAAVVERDVRDAAARMGVNVPSDGQVPDAVIAVDDVLGNSGRAAARLAQHAADHPKNLYVLGCHGEEHQRIVDEFAGHGIAAHRVFLGPFGRQETKLLVNKIIRGASTKLADQVLVVLRENRLPRSPFLMAALAAVIASRPETASFSATTIVAAYVDLMLGRTDLQGLEFLDYRKREHLLEHLAGALAFRDDATIDRLDAELMVAEYFRARAVEGASAGRTIDDFIRRRILMQDARGKVQFRHPVLMQLFAAKLMNEDPEYAAKVEEQIVANDDIVRHAAALTRSNRVLLELVGDAARTVVSSASTTLTDTSLEELLTSGVVDLPTDLKDLEVQLHATAPPSPAVLESRLDELYEDLTPAVMATPWHEGVNLSPTVTRAVQLLSDVVVSAELVDDVEMKVELLKQAIHGWGVVAVSELVREKSGGVLRDSLRRMILQEKNDADADALLDQMIPVTVMLGVTFAGIVALASRRIEGLLVRALESAEFMESATHALLATVMACALRLPEWPERLVDLFRKRGSRPFIRDLTYTLALVGYQSSWTSEPQAVVLETFLADFIVGGTPRASYGPGGRPQLRGKVEARLRKSRAQARMRRLNVDLLDEPDDSDTTDEQLLV